MMSIPARLFHSLIDGLREDDMFEKLRDLILFRALRAHRAGKKFLSSFESEILEEFLELLLKAMNLFFMVNKEFRKNIEDFSGRYLFKSRDDKITVSAVFKNGKMRVSEGIIENPDITVNFKDSKALRNYILSPKPDILGSLLRQDVVPDGNLNYLYKFAYMAKNLQLILLGRT